MEEIKNEELLNELITMLMAALKIAGVKDSKIESAIEAYQNALDEKDPDGEYNYCDIADIILGLKNTHKDLFK